ncbi:hypothetical protein F5884DRAFT_181938 [Xylogone sp. PMI_703]|nr:hypothetical protein F5884DRAFT_181938 [Xylogone sp. PMI_703]
MPTFAQKLAIESWALYGVGLFIIACRMGSRWIQLGGELRKAQPDDWIMIFIIFTYTGVIVSTIQVANNGSNYLPPGVAETLTPPEIRSAIWGSKMTLVLEEFTLTTIWLLKGCVLLMYSRLTLGLRQNIAVKCLAVYCAFGYILVQVLFLGVWCRPIQQYWAVPVRNSQCATYYNHLITSTVFNISSDLMMLLIPLPLLITSKLPLKRKIVLCGVFSLGIFVILAAILNRYYNFSVAYSPIFLNWYVGEVSTAVYVANIPLCWPLVRRIFSLGSFADSKRSRSNENSNYHLQSSSKLYGISTLRQRGAERLSSNTGTNVGLSESEERITGSGWAPDGNNSDQLELTPAAKTAAFKSNIVGGGSKGADTVDEGWDNSLGKEAIIKTVQVSQYTS